MSTVLLSCFSAYLGWANFLSDSPFHRAFSLSLFLLPVQWKLLVYNGSPYLYTLFALDSLFCVALSPLQAVFFPNKAAEPRRPSMEVLFPTDSSPKTTEAAPGVLIADIVAVHGLASNADTTWNARSQFENVNGVTTSVSQSAPMWLRDFLPKEELNARILAFNHNTTWFAGALGKSLDEHGKDLLRGLRRVRQTPQEESRPIVFIGHSFGGLIIKEAIVLAKREVADDFCSKLCEQVQGFVFLGTPHKGARLTKIGILTSFFGHWRGSNTSLLKIIEQNSTENRRLHESFMTFLRQSCGFEHIVCVFEAVRETFCGFPVNHVVEKDSAILDVCPAPQQIGFDKTHRELQRYSSREDAEYKDIVLWIRKWLRGATSKSQRKKIESKKESLQSLAFPEMDLRRNDIVHETDETCRWLLTHSQYLTWIGQTTGLLWIKGNPGTGKSTLLNFALRQYQDRQRLLPKKCAVAAFFFHGRGAPIQRTSLGLFRSLLHQILCQNDDLLSEFTSLFENECLKRGQYKNSWEWHVAELRIFFQVSLVRASIAHPVRIYVDALDECGEKAAKELVKFFQDVTSQSPQNALSICFSCRRYPLLGFSYGPTICVDEENSRDIATYVGSTFQTVKGKAQELETQIVEKASGNFQWIVLVTPRIVGLLESGEPPKAVAKILLELPSDLDDLYRGILEEVDGTDRQRLFLLMQWICFAERPLTLDELRVAMVIDADGACQYSSISSNTDVPWIFTSREKILSSDEYVSTDEDMQKRLLRLSRGLVEVREGLVQLIHESVKEHLIKRGLQDISGHSTMNVIGEAHFRLSRICIRYTFMDEALQCVTENMAGPGFLEFYYQPNLQLSFLDYAGSSWLIHAQKAEAEEILQRDLPQLLEWPSKQRLDAWIRLMDMGLCADIEGATHGTNLLHLSALNNLASVVASTPDSKNEFANAKDGLGHTPISYAALKGNKLIVKLLLDRGVEGDPKDKGGRTPLSLAAEDGHKEMVELLLSYDSIEADSRDEKNKTPLSWAAAKGHETIVERLIDRKDVDMSSKSNSGRTPLSYAIDGGHETIVKLLLCHGDVEVDFKDKEGRTALSYAAERGNRGIVEQLVNRNDVDADSKDASGDTPLYHAVECGHETVARWLAKREDVKVDSTNNFAQTPLWIAAKTGHTALVSLLLELKAKINHRDVRGRTPLWIAVAEGHDEVVEILIGRDDVDINSKHCLGITPLDVGYLCGDNAERTTKLLKDKGAVISGGDRSRFEAGL